MKRLFVLLVCLACNESPSETSTCQPQDAGVSYKIVTDDITLDYQIVENLPHEDEVDFGSMRCGN